MTCRFCTLCYGHEANENPFQSVLAAGQEPAAVPEDQGLTAKTSAVCEAEKSSCPLALAVSCLNMAVQELLVPVADCGFHRESRDCSDRLCSFGSELRAFYENGRVHLVELHLVPVLPEA